MQDAAVVGGGEARANLARDVERLVGRQAADAQQQRSEILAVDVLHREEVLAPISDGLADVEHAADVRVRDLARDADLGQEPLVPDGIVGERARQEFQRDRRTELDVVGPVDLAHASAAEQADDAVAASEHGPRRHG